MSKAMLFDCSLCTGICCTNAPTLVGKKEVDQALALGVELIALKVKDGRYIVSLKQVFNRCPLNITEGAEKGKCKIHDDKFAVCKHVTCDNYEIDIEKITSSGFMSANTTEVLGEEKALFSKKFVKNYNIEIAKSRYKYLMATAVQDQHSFMEESLDIWAKIATAGYGEEMK